MAKEIYSLSLDSIKLLCGLIRDLASVSDGILDTAICTDKTFSSYYIDLLLKQLKADSEAYTDEVASALTKLTAEVVTVEPTLDNTTNKINTILLYSPNGNDVYDQYLRLETQLISLGSTQISMADYIKTSEADNKYSTKTELKAVTDKIGTTALTTTAQTLTGSIEEVKGIAEQGALLTVTKEQYDQLVAGQTVNIDGKNYTYDDNTYYVVKDDGDTITTTTSINSSSTNSEVPTAKAVNDSYHIKTYTKPEQLGLADGCSVSDIFLALPDNSYFECGQNTTKTDVLYNITGVPTNGGVLTIRKQTQFRFAIEYKISGGGSLSPNQLYIGQLKGSDGSGLEWQRVVTTKVSDVPETVIRIDTLSSDEAKEGEIIYMVKDGICHMTITNLKVKNTNHILKMFPDNTIPKCAIRERWYVLTDTTDATNNILVNIRQEGSIGHYQVGNVDKAYSGSFSYPVAE